MPWSVKLTEARRNRGRVEGFDVDSFLVSADLLTVQVRQGHQFVPGDKVIVWKATGDSDAQGKGEAIALAEVHSVPASAALPAVPFGDGVVVKSGEPRVVIRITLRRKGLLKYEDLEPCLSAGALDHWKRYRIGKSYELSDAEYDCLLGRAGVLATEHGLDTLPREQIDERLAVSKQKLETPEGAEQAKLEMRRAREDQSPFRHELMRAYEGRCTVTGCAVGKALEAAHIIPYTGPESQLVNNGVLLRADVHRLFDAGLMWIDPDDLTIQIHHDLAKTEYQDLAGRPLELPKRAALRPRGEDFKWRNEWFLKSDMSLRKNNA